MGSARAASPAVGRIVSVNPATGVPLGDVPDMTADEVRAAVGRARAAQVEWGALPVETRCKRVARLAEVVMARADEVIELLSKEMGKTKQERSEERRVGKECGGRRGPAQERGKQLGR